MRLKLWGPQTLPCAHTRTVSAPAERQAPPGGAAVQVKFRQRRPAGVQVSSSSASAAARAGAVQIMPSTDGLTSGSTPVTPGKLEHAAEDTPRNTSPSVSSQALHRLRQMVRGSTSSTGAGEQGGSACTVADGMAAAAVLFMHVVCVRRLLRQLLMLEEGQRPPGKGPAVWLTALRLTASHFPQAAGTGGRAPAMGWSQTAPHLPRPCLSQQRCRRAPAGAAVWAGPATWGIAATALLWTTFSTPVRLVPTAATITRQTQVSPNVQVPENEMVSWCWAIVVRVGAEPPRRTAFCAQGGWWKHMLLPAGHRVSLMSLRMGNGWGGGGGGRIVGEGVAAVAVDIGQQVDAAGWCAVPWGSSWKIQLLAPRCRPCPLETTNCELDTTLAAGTMGLLVKHAVTSGKQCQASQCVPQVSPVAAVPAMSENAAEQPLQSLEAQIPSARELDSLVAPLEQPRQQQSPAGALQQPVALPTSFSERLKPPQSHVGALQQTAEFPHSVLEQPVAHQSPAGADQQPAGSPAMDAGSEASPSGSRLPLGDAPAENGWSARHTSQQQVARLSDTSPASMASNLGHLGAQQRASVFSDSLPASRASSLESWRSATSRPPSADVDLGSSPGLLQLANGQLQAVSSGVLHAGGCSRLAQQTRFVWVACQHLRHSAAGSNCLWTQQSN